MYYHSGIVNRLTGFSGAGKGLDQQGRVPFAILYRATVTVCPARSVHRKLQVHCSGEQEVDHEMKSSLLSMRLCRDYPGRLAIVGNGGSCTYEDILNP